MKTSSDVPAAAKEQWVLENHNWMMEYPEKDKGGGSFTS
jgi:hypothetical protein